MHRSILAVLLLSAVCLFKPSAVFADDKTELAGLLAVFLDGATRNDASVHNRFWAEELIYTSSTGKRFGKAELMKGVETAGPLPAEKITTRYGSEQLQIVQYGDTAVVAFILVAESSQDSKRFYNTGTFVKRAGQWQAVSWQATVLAQ